MAEALPPPAAPILGAPVVPVPPRSPTCAQQATAAVTQAARRARWTRVWALRRQGQTMAAIAHRVGLHVTTVCRYLQQADYQPFQPTGGRGRSLLNPYKPYLLRRWNEGCHHARRLYRELKQHGYPGSYTTLANYTQRLRQAQGVNPGQHPSRRSRPVVVEPDERALTPRQAAWLLLKRPERQAAADGRQLDYLKAQHPDLATAIDLAQAFATLVRQRRPEQLDAWLERAAKSPLAPFRNLAASLDHDVAAVRAAVTLPWSTGPVEGHVHRLKLVKRQSYGRASIDLLSRRFLLAA